MDWQGLAALPARLVQGGTGEWWRLSLGGAASRLMANDWVAVPVRQVPEREKDGFKGFMYHRWFGVNWGECGGRAYTLLASNKGSKGGQVACAASHGAAQPGC